MTIIVEIHTILIAVLMIVIGGMLIGMSLERPEA